MNILIDMVHPADLHFFKHAARAWAAAGHRVLVTARDKDVLVPLLARLGWPHAVLSRRGRNLPELAREMVSRAWHLRRFARRRRVDVLTGFSAVSAAQAGWLLGKPAVAFYDADHARLINRLTVPFCTVLCTPEHYLIDHGRKQRRFRGCKESAYIHPAYFRPQAEPLRQAGVRPEEPYAVLRFTSWQASHDRGLAPLATAEKVRLVRELSRLVRVFVVGEGPLPPELAPWRLSLPPQFLHDLLAYARLVLGDGSTTVVEAALAGTPGIYLSPLKVSTVSFLEERFGLVHDFAAASPALARARELLGPGAKEAWREKANRYFAYAEDVTEFIRRTVLEWGAGGRGGVGAVPGRSPPGVCRLEAARGRARPPGG